MPSPRTLAGTLRDGLALSPAVILGALALVPLLILSFKSGGFFPTDWYPAGLFLFALLFVGLLALPAGGGPQAPVRVAVAALAAYAVWSYLSIGWSDQRADAWDGANRTALYAGVFALFALWRIRGSLAAGLVGVFALGVAAIGLVELIDVAGTDRPEDHFMDGRLADPVGYVNGNVALWSAAFWPCVVLAARREVAAPLRALFGGSAVLLGGLALMGQSRGWLFALPVVTIVFLAVTPRRVRTSLTLLAVLAAVATTIPAVLDVSGSEEGAELADAVDRAVGAVLLAAALAPIAFGAAALLDRRARAPRRVERGAGLALGALAAGALFLGALVYVSERGNPATDVADAWDEFKTQGTPGGGAERLTALGSNRYDFWRVAWNQFDSAPLKGVGADTFQQDYLADARSGEQPRYPHSVELRTLSQTGLIGALLLSVGLAAALLSAWQALRLRRGPAQAAAAAGVAAFTYWLVHGSVDWFWEIPALGGAAFAMLGLAAGLAPRRPALRPAPARRPFVRTPAGGVAAAATAMAFLVSAGPWLSELYVDQSLDNWRRDADFALERLDRARTLNPLNATPDVAAGSIALQIGRTEEAESRFRAAVDRNGGDSHSHLRLGAIVFNDGRREEGLRHLREAARLDRRDEIIRRALARARRGREIDIRAMNQAIADRYREIGDR